MRIPPRQDRCDGFIHNAYFIQYQFVGLQNPPFLPFTEKSECLTKFSTYNEVQKCTMTLLLALDPASPNQVPRCRGVHVVYEFFKRNTIPADELEFNLHAHVFGASDELDTLKDDGLKHYHLLGISLPRSYAAEIYCEDRDKLSPDLTRRCVISLGRKTDKFFTFLATYHPL